MRIHIREGLLSFDGDSVRYDRRYLSDDELRLLLREWVHRLAAKAPLGNRIYLPFSINDEYVEAFEVEECANNISLRAVRLDSLGYVPTIDPLMETITGDLPVVERSPSPFLVCDRGQLVAAVEALLDSI